MFKFLFKSKFLRFVEAPVGVFSFIFFCLLIFLILGPPLWHTTTIVLHHPLLYQALVTDVFFLFLISLFMFLLYYEIRVNSWIVSKYRQGVYRKSTIGKWLRIGLCLESILSLQSTTLLFRDWVSDINISGGPTF